MSPRVLDTPQCPHCKGALPRPTPRVCPHCAGSLQVRFMTSGCLTSAPKLVLAAGATFGAYEVGRGLFGWLLST